MMQKITRSVTLPFEMYDEIKTIAKSSGENVMTVIRQLLREALDERKGK